MPQYISLFSPIAKPLVLTKAWVTPLNARRRSASLSARPVIKVVFGRDARNSERGWFGSRVWMRMLYLFLEARSFAIGIPVKPLGWVIERITLSACSADDENCGTI
jgi:hypothetical protein